jgi:hypothetical protein
VLPIPNTSRAPNTVVTRMPRPGLDGLGVGICDDVDVLLLKPFSGRGKYRGEARTAQGFKFRVRNDMRLSSSRLKRITMSRARCP